METRTHDHVDALERSLAKTYGWVHEVRERAGLDGDATHAYHVLRAVLHALRDRLGADVAAHLAAQMPLLVRGIFYEGWDPSRTPVRLSAAQFVARVGEEAGLKGTSAAEDAARAVLAVCWEELGDGVMSHVVAVLPEDFSLLL